jgi:hypothetical protein
MPKGWKRYYGQGQLHFLTFSCCRRLQVQLRLANYRVVLVDEKAAAGLPHSKSLLRNIMRDSAGTARPGNAFAAALAKIRERYHFLLVGYVVVDL